jgi:SAM-dependent methyltransferase
VFDYGAGSGTMARLLADLGHEVQCYEPTIEMVEVFRERTTVDRYPGIRLLTDMADLQPNAAYDTVICSNVVDHLLNVPAVLAQLRGLLLDEGHLLLSIPHPMKNRGTWVKDRRGDNWRYLYYRLDGYLNEGQVKRDREDMKGNVIIKDVVSQHRTISTYYNWIRDAGFSVHRMYEPAPPPEMATRYPELWEQSSRIAYFWILDCTVAVDGLKQPG